MKCADRPHRRHITVTVVDLVPFSRYPVVDAHFLGGDIAQLFLLCLLR